MRLSPDEIKHIKACVAGFDPDARVFLFGSRVDDMQKGGDIDLLILSKQIDFHSKLGIKAKLLDFFEEQKMDILIEKSITKPFIHLIYRQAVEL